MRKLGRGLVGSILAVSLGSLLLQGCGKRFAGAEGPPAFERIAEMKHEVQEKPTDADSFHPRARFAMTWIQCLLQGGSEDAVIQAVPQGTVPQLVRKAQISPVGSR